MSKSKLLSTLTTENDIYKRKKTESTDINCAETNSATVNIIFIHSACSYSIAAKNHASQRSSIHTIRNTNIED